MVRYSFLYLCILLSTLFFIDGCKKRSPEEIKPGRIVWDRDICTRCLMAISGRKYAAELIDPDSRKVYVFDDIGCAILWLDEKKPSWKDRAIYFVMDRGSGEWLNAKMAYYTTKDLTPMGFGFGATGEKLLDMIDFKEMKRRMLKGETAQKRYLKFVFPEKRKQP